LGFVQQLNTLSNPAVAGLSSVQRIIAN